MATPITEAQIRFLDILASKLDLRDAWELLAEEWSCSRSKAQKSATMAGASKAIEAAKERVATKERRAGKIEGEWDDGDILIDGKWYGIKDEVANDLRTLQANGPVDLRALLADRIARKAAGSQAPWTEAIAALRAARPAVETAKSEAIKQIRDMMAKHGLSVEDLR